MSRLFAGSCMGPYIPADGSCTDSSDSAYRDAAFVRNSIFLAGSTTYAESFHHATSTDFWFTGDLFIDSTNASGSPDVSFLSLYNSSDIEVYKLTINAATLLVKQWTSPDGSAFTQRGSSFTITQDTRHTISVHLNTDATGSAKVYVSGTERLSATGIDLSGLTNVEYHRLKGSLRTFWSQCICADAESTIGMRIMELYPSGAGASTDWTGTYAGIDETVYSDTDFVFSDAANEVSTYAGTLVGSLSGYTVAGVAVCARGKTDGTGPTNLNLALRTAATNYYSSNIALGAGYTANVNVWDTNPNTTLAWTSADASAVQIGMRSIA